MSDTWLQAPTALINMSNIDLICPVTKKDQVTVSIFMNGEKDPIPIAIMVSQKAALKFLKVVSNLIKENKKCIDSVMIAEQCNNDPE